MSVRIAIINESSAVSEAELTHMIKALQLQVQRDWYPQWGVSASLVHILKGHKPPAHAWWLVLLDNADQAGALGYHDITPQGMPLGKVFAVTTIQAQGMVSVTLSHELLEMLGDPAVNLLCQDGTDQESFWAYEVCLAGETEIPLADGSRPAIGELAARGLLHARKTARAASLLRVRLTDGTVVRCTPEHRLLLACGHYLAAANLRSGDVLPCPTPADAIDRADVYAVPGRHETGGVRAGADREDVGCRHLGRVDRGPALVAVAFHTLFRRSVQHVFVVRPGEQVIGSHAGAGIAPVADLVPDRDRSVTPFVRESMSGEDLAVLADLPVAGRGPRTEPHPTVAALIDARPESLLQRRAFGVIRAIREAEIKSPPTMLASPMRRAQAFRSQSPAAPWDGARHVKVIDRVEPDGQEDVFDLTVPEHHNFAVGAGVFVHNCDAVEDDQVGYDVVVDGTAVRVSDFVLPAYFETFRTTGPFDFRNLLTAPVPTLTPGGYMAYVRHGQWHQVFAQTTPAAMRWKARPHEGSRRLRRMLGKQLWVASTRESEE